MDHSALVREDTNYFDRWTWDRNIFPGGAPQGLMSPGDLVTPLRDVAFIEGGIYLYSSRTLGDDDILLSVMLKRGEIATVLDVSMSYLSYTDGEHEIEEWIPVAKILAPSGIGWVQNNYLDVMG